MALQNLTDILINSDKFEEMAKNIYSAIDELDEKIPTVTQVLDFTKAFLEGEQEGGMENTSFKEQHEETYKILTESDSIYVTYEELCEFMRVLLRV